ncbi:MerR family transcriptional regulator [Nonomuraea sp. NPDC026600]|uniref:MerR family transcriptional regulator n=1 Tax=Nonomuraea sp. NPDC026600 TaxID=3155363 RepID=UPI0033D0698D
MTGSTPELSIGQVAERTGLSVHTLRLYEREGLFASQIRRRTNGRRIYSEWDVEWLSSCMRFRASGMPLATIRRFAELIRQGPGNEDERLALLRQHQQQVLARIAELTECLNLITQKVGVYEEHVSQGTASALWSTGNHT